MKNFFALLLLLAALLLARASRAKIEAGTASPNHVSGTWIANKTSFIP